MNKLIKKISVKNDTLTELRFASRKEFNKELLLKWKAELEEYKKGIAQREKENEKRWVRQGEIVIDKKLGLMWQDDESVSWDYRKSENPCRNLVKAGYSDWRLPSYLELVSIVDYDHVHIGKYNAFKDKPSIIKVFKHIGRNQQCTSRRVYIFDSNTSLSAINFMTGRISYEDVVLVRCVRDIK